MRVIHVTRRELVEMYVFAKTQDEVDAVALIAEKPLSDLVKVRTYATVIDNELVVLVKGVQKY